jgi:hypothetical protein
MGGSPAPHRSFSQSSVKKCHTSEWWIEVTQNQEKWLRRGEKPQ